MGAITESDIHAVVDDAGQAGGRSTGEITGYDSMEPFLMTLVSDSDLWMYVSSLGSLSAGRVDEDHALFPYCVEDVIHRGAGKTGPITLVRVLHGSGRYEIWEPFAQTAATEGIFRKLSKSVLGNKIVFEESHERLGLTFRYQWASCDRFGFVRTAELINDGPSEKHIDILDGLLNLLPPGITYNFQQRLSVLVDAYTECEVDPCSGLAMVSLAAQIVDRPEPGEALHANTVWSRGIDHPAVLLSDDQIRGFREGKTVNPECSIKGRRSNFVLSSSLQLASGGRQSWDIVADVNRTQCEVEAVRAFLQDGTDQRWVLQENLESSAENLERYVAAADGQPFTADERADRHLQACVLFNIMRGGIFADGDKVAVADFRHFVSTRNKARAAMHQVWLESLPETLPYSELIASADSQGDPSLRRIAREYLPLTFSRRHGDPSRPWNRFAIRLKNPDGSPLLAYQGNWRDIFQNWEALSLSYPMFVESIVAKFLNASTVDGFNPYRVTREGIEWELPSPDDPWTSMGYWGDHQIIYLLKFLEQANNLRPDLLAGMLGEKLFSYANVPLRLRPYEKIVRNPHATIDFVPELNRRIELAVAQLGTDARLLEDADGEVYHVALAEKLLVPALSKLSNLVLDAGIWMNTQRPEWNDANNALVGNGVSMVTLCYLRRYLVFCKSLFTRGSEQVEISKEVADWLQGITAVLEGNLGVLQAAEVSNGHRRSLLDSLGEQFSTYRERVYAAGFSGSTSILLEQAAHLCALAIPYLDHSIRAAKRSDGLYHAYNLVDLRQPGIAPVTHLYEMLEGQVAVLSAGVLTAGEVAGLIDALFVSKMYRRDQETFMLYPDRELPGFLAKNIIPAPLVAQNPLFGALLAAGDPTVIVRDSAGNHRFAPSLNNADALRAALVRLDEDPQWGGLVLSHREETLNTYESVFGHRFFTGRSGAMYAYEGLGSIYWHMVSKLLVAVQEAYFQGQDAEARREDLRRIADGYYGIRSGMGFNKTAYQFGAFPSDPYSHTPAGRGAKQPGMTGQSKEDILARWMEFGVFLDGGKLKLRPSLLRRQEFCPEPRTWHLRDCDGKPMQLDLPKDSLGFTVCGVPIVYQLDSTGPQMTVEMADGTIEITRGPSVSQSVSAEIFARSGDVRQITVYLTDRDLM